MIIYTGYYAGIPNHFYPFPISIAQKTPQWFIGETADFLAPPQGWFFRWKRTFEEVKRAKLLREEWKPSPHQDEVDIEIAKDPIKWYTDMYMRTVLNEAPEIIYEQLEKIAPNQREITLMCYERPLDANRPWDTFCHRNIVAAYLKWGGFDVQGEFPLSFANES
jgi:hypothetical protein